MESTSSKPVLGLAFHPDSISLVSMEDGVVKGTAVRELVQPFDLETFRTTGEFLNGQDKVLQDLYQQSGGLNRDVSVVLHSGMVLIKKIPVAMGLEEKLLQDQLVWEAGQFLVSPMDDYVVEYQRLPFQDLSGNPFYLLILMRKSVLQGVRILLQKNGLRMQRVDVDLFSNIRALLANYDLDFDVTSVLVDVRRDYIDFIFLRHREFFLSHRVALEKKNPPRLPDEEEIAKLIIKELRRLIFGHRLGKGIEDLNRLFIIGGDGIQSVSQHLLSSISIPLDIVNPFRRVKVSQAVKDSSSFSRYPEKFVSSVGVILRQDTPAQ